MQKLRLSDLAAIEYLGSEYTAPCIDAVMCLLQSGERIERVRIITAEARHALLVHMERDRIVAVKAGFASGYPGEGPKGLAYVLGLLEAFGVDIDEWVVDEAVLVRLNASALLREDVDAIDAAGPRRPRRWGDYLPPEAGTLGIAELNRVRRFRLAMPWALIDERVFDLALAFFRDPDKAVVEGFRRLEDLVRVRTGSQEHGAKLFSLAFAGEASALMWRRPQVQDSPAVRNIEREKGRPAAMEPLDKGEQAGRASLFTGAYQAFRNPRAHRTPEEDEAGALAEFLVLNQLFRLEREAVARLPGAGS